MTLVSAQTELVWPVKVAVQVFELRSQILMLASKLPLAMVLSPSLQSARTELSCPVRLADSATELCADRSQTLMESSELPLTES